MSDGARTAWVSHPPRGIDVVFLLVVTLGVASVLVPFTASWAETQEDGPWNLLATSRMGDPPEDPPYTVRLFTTGDPERPPPPGETKTFRLELLWRANATHVEPAPPLLLRAAHCTSTVETPPVACDEALATDTETVHALAPHAPAGEYRWTADPAEALGAAGTWALHVHILDEAQMTPARFVLAVETPPPVTPVIWQIVEGLFGIGVGPFGAVLAFLFWLVFFVLSARILAFGLRRTVFSPYRVDPTVGRLAVRLFAGLWVVFGVALAMWAVWRVNFWAALAALGLLSVALGFGMQNTVANVMGGVNLALDKPFVIGDRVRIGDTWGEVEEVGIRSTKIQTTKKELVIVPNKLMDEREIWNYTRDQPELRRDIEVLISYDSDRALAESLMLEAAREHKEILPYPRPRVFVRDFAESGVLLQLRCWIPEARNLRAIGSELRKAIHDKFNEDGVEIPYPYRTLVEKKDLPAPHRATPEEVESHLPPDVRAPKLLYATAGPEPLSRTAGFVARLAHALDMQLLVLHIHTGPRRTWRATDAYRIFSAFEDAAARHQVHLKTLQGQGDVVEEIKRVIARDGVDLLAIGSSRPPFRWSPRKVADLTMEIRDNVKVPVFIVPKNLRVTHRTLQHYRSIIEKRAITRRRKEQELTDTEAETTDMEWEGEDGEQRAGDG